MTYQNSVVDFTTAVQARLTVPVNQKDRLLVTGASGRFSGRSVFIPTSIVETDEELATQKGVAETFQSVFKWWKRISRGGSTYTDEFLPAELNSWAYDQAGDSIKSTINSASVMGLVSPEKYDDYVFEVELSSTDADDDFIGLIMAYALDPVTRTTHTLSVMRSGQGPGPMLIEKDFNGFATGPATGIVVTAGLTWLNGTTVMPGGNNTNGGWNLHPNGCRVKVTRKQDIITVETTQVGSDQYYTPAKTVIDLSTNPDWGVFRGPQSFGYTAMSQAYSTWKVFQRPDIRSPIIDVRDWSKWVYANDEWTKVNSTKANLIIDELLVPEWTHHNVTTGKFFYMDSSNRLYRL